jgi:hypothetical protein
VISRPWVKLYRGEEGSFAQLPLFARALAAELLKIADDEGCIYLGGRTIEEAIAWQLGATRGDRRLLKMFVPMLLVDRYLVAEPDHGRVVIKSLKRIQSGEPPMPEPDTSRARSVTDGATTRPRQRNDGATTEPRRDHDHATTEQRQRNETGAKCPESIGGTERALKDLREEKRRGEQSAGARASEPRVELLEPDDETPVQREAWLQLWQRWELVAFGGLPGGDAQSHRKRLTAAHAACAARRAHDPAGLFEQAARVFCADCDQRGERRRLDWLCNQIGQWLEAPAKVVAAPDLTDQLRLARNRHAELEYALRLKPDSEALKEQVKAAEAVLEQLRGKRCA